MMLTHRVLRANFKTLRRLLWTVETRGDDLVLREDNKEELHYPHVWLRDNCQCPLCFHKNTNSRTIDIEHFDFDAKPLKTTINNSLVDVKWSDNHESQYSLSWLLGRQFTPESQADWLEAWYRPAFKPWSASQFKDILQRFQYDHLMTSNDGLLQWLESLAVVGVAFVENAGRETGKLKALAERIAFLKRTSYGEMFTVVNKPDTSNYAYLSGNLQLHTDVPYYNYKPGINMLHCINQDEGQGGVSSILDGQYLCEWIKTHHPQHYWILSTVPVVWEDIVVEEGREYHNLYRAPVICEGQGGVVDRVNWSMPQRSSHFSVPLDQVTAWYRALQVFTNQMHSPECKVLYKMKPGEIVTFNNIRMLHGRSAYQGNRHLEGGYVDWDHIYSKIRVLKKQLNKS